uniref:Uncharacterized protein n=1 Tax=Romanomermis culicivorax TaxID=13658 RepID=A0A915IB21_ROMCU
MWIKEHRFTQQTMTHNEEYVKSSQSYILLLVYCQLRGMINGPQMPILIDEQIVKYFVYYNLIFTD